MFYTFEQRDEDGNPTFTTVVIPHITMVQLAKKTNELTIHLNGGETMTFRCDTWEEAIDLSSTLEDLIFEYYSQDE